MRDNLKVYIIEQGHLTCVKLQKKKEREILPKKERIKDNERDE